MTMAMMSSSSSSMIVVLLQIIIVWSTSNSVVEAFSIFPSRASSSSSTSTILFYRNAQDAATTTTTTTTTTPPPSLLTTEEETTTTTTLQQQTEAPSSVKNSSSNNKKKKILLVKKPTIYTLSTLDDLQYFLEEDDQRLTVIKYYASWCKSCQKLNQHYHKVAMKLGDGIINRQKIKGSIRFSEIRYYDETKNFITSQLQVKQVPTLQIYVGKYKVWEESGMTNTTTLQKEIDNLATSNVKNLQEYAISMDDGILESAIDDAFFDDSPSFLDEEW